jgi:[ribosomal protein S5]-alanine N-acetyltransferase
MEILFDIYKLRNWQNFDRSSLVKYANNYKIWMNVDDIFPYPYTSEDAAFWINSKNRSNNDFAIATKTEAIGGISLRPQKNIYRKSAELGYWLGEPYWGKGIVTQAVKNMMLYGFENLGILRIYALVFEWNLAGNFRKSQDRHLCIRKVLL